MTARLVAAGAVVLLLAGTASADLGGKLTFVKDYDAGMKEAARTGKATVIYFTADW